jgi:hypothetical protein
MLEDGRNGIKYALKLRYIRISIYISFEFNGPTRRR